MIDFYRTASRSKDYVSQSLVVKISKKPSGSLLLSFQVQRSRSLHPIRGTEHRGWQVWLYVGPIRVNVGSR